MKLYDGREKFYQYDTNQKLICEDCAVGEEIHFSNSAHGDAAICLTYDLDGVVVVDVPNLYLLSASELNVYSMRTEYDGRCTISRHVFGVIPRKKPSDYVYEETEVKSYAELDRRIKKLEENSGAGIDIVGATAGQVAQIAEVDKNGAPTKWKPANLPAVSAMTGATADAAGASGVVPAPAAGDEGKFLRGDGTWGEIDIPEGTTDHTLGISGAAVGQIAKITAVDGNGVPTAWESVNLPSGGSGGGGEWTKLGSVTLTGTFEKIASYENGIITFESFVPNTSKKYLITNKDGTALINSGYFKATDNAGEYKVTNADGGAVTPSIDIANCFVQNPDAENIVIDNQTKYKRYKTRVSAPLFASHGMRQTYIFKYGRNGHDADSNLSTQNGKSLVYETEEVVVGNDIYVKQVAICSGRGFYSNLTRQAATNETKWDLHHYNGMLAIGTQFEVWGAY